MTNPRQCSVRVYRKGSLFSSPCQKNTAFERDGKWYCFTHDPVYIKAKEVSWKAELVRRQAENIERQNLNEAKYKATEGLTLEELQRVTPELIRKALTEKESAIEGNRTL